METQNNIRWKCKKCGACCKTPMTKFWLPDLWDEERSCCSMLTDDNICLVYNNRPYQCRDIDFSQLAGGDAFRIVFCKFLDQHINRGGRCEK